MDFSVPVDGKLSLQQTEKRCEDLQLGGFKIDSIRFGTIFENGQPKLINNADFFMANSTEIFTNLSFVDLGANNAENLKTQMKGQGWTFICDSHIYVQGALQRVLVFGRN